MGGANAGFHLSGHGEKLATHAERKPDDSSERVRFGNGQISCIVRGTSHPAEGSGDAGASSPAVISNTPGKRFDSAAGESLAALDRD